MGQRDASAQYRRPAGQDQAQPAQFLTAPVLTAAVLAVLTAADAALTLALIGRGEAAEANPLMRWALAQGTSYFLALKSLMSLTGILGLIGLWQRRPVAGRKAAAGILLLYAIVIVYSGGLLWLEPF